MAKKKNETFEWIKSLGVALVIVLVVRAFLFTPILVDGASMNTTLHDQDRMIVSKIGEPERFDIVVFHANEKQDYIKRVIGLPGDKIEYRDDTLYVNGKAYKEPYLDEQKAHIDGELTRSFRLEDTAVGQATVPEGHLFVMGDNRRNSTDSRIIGAVPMDQVVGTTNVVFYPLKDMKIIKNK
ncbi:signal peptidase I [Bacillus sp. MKU004]|uniref:signal peptidase I n=1 Tax=[Bacillus] enclensis TaxID=1402860 RepID=UPI0007E34879|nr:signal peptidase I [[Bacillus] enclensis]MBH9966260.1 signal peptidase I [[Bacillus] enclensis]OAT81940.1 signal peptidase I [Bacillus sp. MKU004]QWC23708.1 signal peptidase I [Bacillus haikouensis]